MESIHRPVLLHEVVHGLLMPSSASARTAVGVPWYLDGTLGGAGHALAIVKALKGRVGIIGLDRDPRAIERAGKSLAGKSEKLVLECQSFRSLDAVLDTHGIATVAMILLDLGISSDELEDSGKGFSFTRDEPLLMTMGDPALYPFTAFDVVNGWTEETLADVIFGYGEERYARRIAKALAIYRDKKKVETSGELAEIVRSAVPAYQRRGKIHPATRTFQAIRIAVNDELKALREGLEKGFARLVPGGRMAVISFHSLEDRIVKEFYREQVGHPGARKTDRAGAAILTKKPATPSPQELAENPRSRSAKLRIIQKI